MTKSTCEFGVGFSLNNLLVLFLQNLKKLGIISRTDDDSNDFQSLGQPGLPKRSRFF